MTTITLSQNTADAKDLGGGYKERGSLQLYQNGCATRFVGSSSGVFFSRTVFQSFARLEDEKDSKLRSYDHLYLVKDDDDDVDQTEIAFAPNSGTSASTPSSSSTASTPSTRRVKDKHSNTLFDIPPSIFNLDHSMLPSQHETIECTRKYFQTWHILFPFLDGKEFMSEVKRFFSTDIDDQMNPANSIVFVAKIKAVLSIGSAICPVMCRGKRFDKILLQNSTNVMAFLPHLILASKKESIGALQTILALQVYLVSTFRLRAAHQVGGLAVRLGQDAGLHRCPGRYTVFADFPICASVRKRVWYSLTSLDRFISQHLGLLLQIRQDDFDVCEPGGEEKHTFSVDCPGVNVSSSLLTETELQQNLVKGHKTPRERVTKSFARLMGLNARAISMFNSNLETRKINVQEVLELRTDYCNWWNEAGLQMLSDEQTRGQGVFFRVCYHSAMLNMERPILTGKPGTAIFSGAIQSAIRSSKEIISDLSDEFQRNANQKIATLSVLWPGFVHAAYISALVLAYGARTEEISISIAIQEILRAMDILEAFGKRWPSVRSHALAVQVLLTKLQEMEKKESSKTNIHKRKAEDDLEGRGKEREISQPSSIPSQQQSLLSSSSTWPTPTTFLTDSAATMGDNLSFSLDPSGAYLSWENFLAETEEILLPIFQ